MGKDRKQFGWDFLKDRQGGDCRKNGSLWVHKESHIRSLKRRRRRNKSLPQQLPLNPGSSKAKSYHGWGTPFDSFGCCYEQLGDSIYFKEEADTPGIYVIQYISSSLDWKLGQIAIDQKVDPVVSWDPYLRVTLTFSLTKEATQISTLNLRMPSWTHSDGATATLNARKMFVPAPGNFLSLTRKWSEGDKLVLQFPVSLITEKLKDDRPEYASVQAILYGPYLLAG